MRRVFALVLVGTAFMAPPMRVRAQEVATTAIKSDGDAKAVLDKYCVTCHNDRMKGNFAGLSLQGVNLADTSTSAPSLEKVVKKLRAGTMPPLGAARPDPAAYLALRRFIEGQLDDEAAKHPNPGRTESLHRLNRAEYQNAIRDLLDLE